MDIFTLILDSISLFFMFVAGMFLGSYFSDKNYRITGAITGQMPLSNSSRPPMPPKPEK